MESVAANLAAFWLWTLKATLQGSLLVCLIMLIKIILRRGLPAQWHYALWLVLLIRLALPWAPQSHLSLYNLIPGLASSYPAVSGMQGTGPSRQIANWEGQSGQQGRNDSLSGSSQANSLHPAEGAATAAPPADLPVAGGSSSHAASSGLWPRIGQVAAVAARALPNLWLAGAVILAGYILVRTLGLWRAVRSERPVTDQPLLDLLEDCKMQMRIQTIVAVVVTDKVKTPVLYGFLRPRILLPQGLVEALDPDELEYVFLHELAHLKRLDIYVGWLAALVQVLHWFNPLVWLAFRRMRADQETATDARALRTLTAGEPARYGRTIMRLLEGSTQPQYLPSVAGILEDTSHVERRIQVIARFEQTPPRPLVVLAVLAVLGPITLTDAKNNWVGGKAVSKMEGTTGLAADRNGLTASDEEPAGTIEVAPLVAEGDLFVDPKTGISFRKVKTLAGPSDVLVDAAWLELSPNGRFLIDGFDQVVPLDGGNPFSIVGLPHENVEGQRYVARGCLSPDGEKFAFFSGIDSRGAIWVIHVDPGTGHPTSPARELVECENQGLLLLRWLPDSERIVFNRFDREIRGGIWMVSPDDGTLTQVTDFSTVGIPSPDGESVAYTEGPLGMSKPMWVKNLNGGPPRKIADRGNPWAWSADSKWIWSASKDHFVRLADGNKVDLQWPAAVVGDPVFSWLGGGRKVYFYRSSYELRRLLKVSSVSGGPISEPVVGMNIEPMYPAWWPDSQAIIVEGTWKGSDKKLWALPTTGGPPIPLRMDTSIRGEQFMKEFSPGCKNLLIAALQPNALVWDVWMVPVSWQEMCATGPAVLVFRGWHGHPFPGECPCPAAWSPDGERIALAEIGSLYAVQAVGGDPVELVRASEAIDWLNWSPDGKTVAFHRKNSGVVEEVSSSGGEARTVCPLAAGTNPCCWSPDGQAVIMTGGPGILSASVIDGSTRTLVSPQDFGLKRVYVLGFSPDGKTLAFCGIRDKEPEHLYLLHTESGKVDRLPVEDPLNFCWAPNSRWFSCHTYHMYVKTRPEGVLWEMDVEEALAKLAK